MMEFKNIYFIGIGGAGMMPLAIHCKKLGYSVSGSDISEDSFIQLKNHGIEPIKNHISNLDNIDLVIYTAAVKADNYEYKMAVEKNIRMMKRAEFLGLLTKETPSILVSGSHGKSTTSVMISDIFSNQKDYLASAFIGACAVSTNSNYYDCSSKLFIVEADEYDKSFLKMYPQDLIILNIDNDHLDIYGDIEGLISAFSELSEKLNKNSFLVYNGDDANCKRAIRNSKVKKYSFGLDDTNYFTAENIEFKNFNTKLDLIVDGKNLGRISFCSVGFHNVLNFLATAAMAYLKGISFDEIKFLIKEHFKGLKRRQEIIYNGKYIFIDDYAHHSTEIKQSLQSLRCNFDGRILAIFQPHLYSRTKYQFEEFAKSFYDCDKLLISHIYPAREKPIEGISSQIIYDAMGKSQKNKTEVFDNFDLLYNKLKSEIKPGDMIVSLGAGEINKLLYKLKMDI